MRHSLLFLALGGVTLAACAGSDADTEETGNLDAAETVDFAALELTCQAEAKAEAEAVPGTGPKLIPFSFAVTAGLGGAGVEGRLTAENGGITLFTCRPLTSPGNVLSCTERAQSMHADHYRVNVTKTGEAFTATLTPNATDPKTAMPCTSRTPLAAPTTPDYDTVKTIIANSCSRCHQHEFDSLAKLKQKRSRMVGMVSSGTMPRGQSTFRDTPDGQSLIAFLLESTELH